MFSQKAWDPLHISSKIHRDHRGETIATDDLFRKTLQTQTDHDLCERGNAEWCYPDGTFY